MSKISIVIPVYYNSDTLMDLYIDLQKKVLGKLEQYEIVLVDDGSGDSSWEIMKQIKDQDENVRLLKLSRNFGEHAALLAGLSACTGDCAVTKQADLQEDSTLILEMYESWKQGNKVVLAVRRSRAEKHSQVFMANMYYALMRLFVNKNMPNGGCDGYLIDRKVIEVLERLDEKNSSLTLQILWAGFQTSYIEYDRLEREKGKSRWTFSKKFKLVMDSMLSFSYAPIRFTTWTGIIFNILAVILFISTIVEYFTVGTPIAGWPTLMCVILCSSGLILMTLGILGEYLWRTLDAARSRPPYIIDEHYFPTGDDDL